MRPHVLVEHSDHHDPAGGAGLPKLANGQMRAVVFMAILWSMPGHVGRRERGLIAVAHYICGEIGIWEIGHVSFGHFDATHS